MQIWLRLTILSVLFLFVSCSQKSLSLFFDIPAPSPEEVAQSTAGNDRPPALERSVKKIQSVDSVPASVIKIESAKTWQEAEALLPINKLGERDWALAIKESVIQPRSAIGGERTPDSIFKFDFYIKGEYAAFDAYFPHSTHTEHLDCASCHPKVFRYRGTKITMEKMLEGKYCGTCHGSVAFPISPENCARCHTSLLGE